MREIRFRLVDAFQKPVIRLYGMNVLIDTGADIPVCFFPEMLQQRFQAKKVVNEVSIGTFGEDVRGAVFSVPMFRVGELTFPNLKFFVPNAGRASEFHFILSASMFHRLIYEIDKKTNLFTVKVPDDEGTERHITLYDKDGKEHILFSFDPSPDAI